MNLQEAMWAALEAADIAYPIPGLMSQNSLFSVGKLSRSEHSQAVSIKAVVYNDTTWREVTTMMTIRHPNITQIIDKYRFQYESRDYFAVIEEPALRSLSRDLRLREESKQRFSEKEVIRHGKELVEALAFLQERGIAHRSIHPDNLFVCATRAGKEVLKLGNFWWSLVDASNKVQTLSLSDVSQFSSPLVQAAQQRRELQVSHNVFKSDVYSLGKVLEYMAQGGEFAIGGKFLCAELRSLIDGMAVISEAARPSFLDLQKKYHQESDLKNSLQDPQVESSTELDHFSPQSLGQGRDTVTVEQVHRSIRVKTKKQEEKSQRLPRLPENRSCKQCILF